MLRQKLEQFLRNEDGATAIEYSLIAALLASILTSVWKVFYPDYMSTWTDIGSYIESTVTKATK